MKEVFRKFNITPSFIPSGCTSYVQVLNVTLNKPLKNRISELADLSYEKNLKKWKNEKYTVGDRRIMLTQWIDKAWRKFHKKNPDLIRSTFRKLKLSLTIDESKNAEFSIKDISDIKVGDWRLMQKKIEPNDPVEIDETTGQEFDENKTDDEEEMEYDVMKKNADAEDEASEKNSEEEVDQIDDMEI